MKKHLSYCIAFITLSWFISVPAVFGNLSGEEIMELVDGNKFYEKIEYNATMTIKKKKKMLMQLH